MYAIRSYYDFLKAGETITFSYTITATDSANATATDTVTVTITGTNDAPVIADVGGILNYQEDSGAQVIDSTLTITDFDGTHIESATITISGGYVNGEDVLSFTDTSYNFV